MAMVAWLHVFGVHQVLSLFLSAHDVFLLCRDIVDGAAGHNKGGMAETPFLARTQGRTVGDTPHVSLCRVSFKGASPHTLWRALGQPEPVRRSRARVDTGTSREVMRPHTGSPERHFGATDHAVGVNRREGGWQPQDTCAARAPSRVTVGSRPKNCIFWRYPPYADVRLNLDLDGDVSAMVCSDGRQYIDIDFSVPEIGRLMRTF